MKGASAAARSSESMRSERFHLWRSRKDRAVRWAIAGGGVAVILAVMLIFFYLLWVVIPLFLPADIRPVEERIMTGWEDSSARLLSVEEQQEVGLRLSDAGEIMFFNVPTGEPLRTESLPLGEGAAVVLATNAVEAFGHVAAATDAGDVLVFRHQYETRFPGGVETRVITPELTYPYGETPLLDMPSGDLAGLALSDTEDGLLLAAADRSGLIRINAMGKSANFLTWSPMFGKPGSSSPLPDLRSAGITAGSIWVTTRAACTVSACRRWSRSRLSRYRNPEYPPWSCSWAGSPC
jgi:phosphate transport system permease protein